LESIATKTSLQIDFGGGIKTNEAVQLAFDCGAKQITGGSIAVSNPEIFSGWISKYGADKIILGADCNNRKIATNGWLKESGIDVIDFIDSYQKKGIRNVICTDISKDGMLQGASNELYREIMKATGISLIASGGVSCMNDLYQLKEIGCEGVILGKAIYEGNITLKELQQLC
jgi:phosphoribosylformimino-5-aminoimidazole carboxamide ribotide isomerase